ncbi:MAG: Holliday junction resolvase RuvX [Myxococcaceae bacterium]
MRALGLDIGTKRIGVALSDELGMTAQPLAVLENRGKAVIRELANLAKTHEVQCWVVGLPLNMDGTEGPMAQMARGFGAQLEAATRLHVIFWDERLSSVAAERALLEGDVSRQRRRQVIDQVAAALILQGWLDSQAKAPQEE